MRRFFVVAFFLLLDLTASAATLKVTVSRQGFTGPIQVAVAPRVDGKPPRWSATKTLAAGESAVSFGSLTPGLYVVLASGPQPLQRLSTKANLGSDGSTLRLAIPRSKTELRATLAGQPLPARKSRSPTTNCAGARISRPMRMGVSRASCGSRASTQRACVATSLPRRIASMSRFLRLR